MCCYLFFIRVNCRLTNCFQLQHCQIEITPARLLLNSDTFPLKKDRWYEIIVANEYCCKY